MCVYMCVSWWSHLWFHSPLDQPITTQLWLSSLSCCSPTCCQLGLCCQSMACLVFALIFTSHPCWVSYSEKYIKSKTFLWWEQTSSNSFSNQYATGALLKLFQTFSCFDLETACYHIKNRNKSQWGNILHIRCCKSK